MFNLFSSAFIVQKDWKQVVATPLSRFLKLYDETVEHNNLRGNDTNGCQSSRFHVIEELNSCCRISGRYTLGILKSVNLEVCFIPFILTQLTR